MSASAGSPLNPHQGVRVFRDYLGPINEVCDTVVVGSGPAGAVVAKELAEHGIDVVLVEEGPPFGQRDFVAEAGRAMNRMLREGGTRATRGNMFIPTMQARALGGGSLINSAICARAPDWVWTKWAQSSGVELSAERMAAHYRRIEQFLGVEPTSMQVQGARNLKFKEGCDALGISSEPTWRNVKGCRGSAECFTGCRNGAKKSTDVSYVPAAIRAGARVLTSVRVEGIDVAGRVARGVYGHVVVPFSDAAAYPVQIRARRVVLAAGCMQTPVILQKSNVLPNNRHVGQHLMLHPGLAIMAVFPERIDPWTGATQGYHSLHYLQEGLKLEVLWSPPEVLAARLPGVGHAFQKHLLSFDRMAPFDVIVAAEHSRGAVTARARDYEPEIRFHFDDRDVKLIQRGLVLLSDICFAAGAEAVLPGIHGAPEEVRTKEQAARLSTMKLSGRDTICAANHAFGTTRMSRSPREGVTDEFGRCHGFENLFIADTGLFAGSSAVNPMLTCMALADRLAEHIISVD